MRHNEPRQVQPRASRELHNVDIRMLIVIAPFVYKSHCTIESNERLPCNSVLPTVDDALPPLRSPEDDFLNDPDSAPVVSLPETRYSCPCPFVSRVVIMLFDPSVDSSQFLLFFLVALR